MKKVARRIRMKIASMMGLTSVRIPLKEQQWMKKAAQVIQTKMGFIMVLMSAPHTPVGSKVDEKGCSVVEAGNPLIPITPFPKRG